MNKCEWKDGVYKPCEKMAKQIIDDVTEKGSFILSDYTECGCGGNLKPEEKPLIVKSGETWVKYENDENYLCVNPYNYNNGFKDFDNWKLFSEIELTDDIAKLRPVVKMTATNNMSKIYTLIYISKESCVVANEFTGGLYWKGKDQIRLATPHELQESE